MKSRLPLFFYALSTSLFLAGFGSCGVDEVDPIPRPCVQLSEDECAASPSCELVPIATDANGLIAPDAEAPISDCVCPAICELRADGTCAPCECNQPPPTYECRPKLPDDCANLGEDACLANVNCEPIYRGVACLQAPPADPCDPSIPGCGAPVPCEPGIEFAGCQERPVSCGPVCDIYCPYGNVRDQNGCETCACNPPPTGCEGLDEYQCIQSPDCRPIYQAGDDPTDCLCAPCADGEVCDCRCGTGNTGSGSGAARPEPPPGTYLGCEYNQPTRCAGLDEAACISTRGCRPVYDGGGATEPGFCYCPPCDPDSNEPCPGCDCAPTPPPGFSYCEDDVPQACSDLDEASCHREPGCEAHYSTVTVCSGGEGPGGAGVPCDPATGCTDRPAPPCYEETQFDGCFPLGGGQACGSDADCPNGYCEKAGYCDAAGCEDYSYCVNPSCDDGTAVVCLILPPVCAAGQTLAVRNGCYECVDARSCGYVPPGECASDADCPNGYCEHYATCTAIGCPPPPPSQCVYPRCDDGSEPLCPSLPMECAPGETLAVRNNCWECVDARSCTPPTHTCDDPAGLIYCDALPPECAPGLVVAARNGCWACVEPTTCQEVSCSDGSELACRALAPSCPPDSLLGIVNGCWACLDQNCQ